MINDIKNIKIAVATTLYSGDDLFFAEKALLSLYNQNYDQTRVFIYLFVDGALPDTHKEFLSRHANKFHIIIHSDKNVGLACGLNAIFSNLNDEEYIFRMDLDDICHPNRFIKQIEFMEAHSNIDLCGCNTYEIDDFDVILYERNYPETHNDIVNRLPRSNPILHPTYCIRSKSLRSSGLKYRDLRLNEDLGFVFDAVSRGWILHNIQERLFMWRTGEKFFSRRTIRRSIVEFSTYFRGCINIWGVSWRLFWPIIRLFSRFIPVWAIKYIYHSYFRNKILG